MSLKDGDLVEVKPEHDLPPMFRPDGKPTIGVIERIDGDSCMVIVPIGDDDPREHSQAVYYELEHLQPASVRREETPFADVEADYVWS